MKKRPGLAHLKKLELHSSNNHDWKKYKESSDIEEILIKN